MTFDKVVIATTSRAKFVEFSSAYRFINDELKPKMQLISLEEAYENRRIPKVEETGTSFDENAKIKAQFYAKDLNLPCISDDSGLCIDILDGRPGLFSARYMGEASFEEKVEHLIHEMKERGFNQSTAHYVCSLAFVDPRGKELLTTGVCFGMFKEKGAGCNGFVYDRHFYPEFSGVESDQSYAQLGRDVKDTTSHRFRAFKVLLQLLKMEEQRK